MLRRHYHWGPLALAAWLAACSAPPPPPPPTVVNLSAVAGRDMNPAPDGTGAPVVLRVYQLGSSAGFGNAEFFPLYNADAATLGSDLVKREDLQLSPGDSRTMTLNPGDTVKAIGLFAGLRDFQSGAWRAVAEVPAHKTTTIKATLGHDGIVMTVETPPPPPKPAS